MVPRFWIWIEPTSSAAAFSPSKPCGRSAATSSDQVAPPPITTESAVTRDALQLGDAGNVHDRARPEIGGGADHQVGAARQHQRPIAGRQVQSFIQPGRLREQEAGPREVCPIEEIVCVQMILSDRPRVKSGLPLGRATGIMRRSRMGEGLP